LLSSVILYVFASFVKFAFTVVFAFIVVLFGVIVYPVNFVVYPVTAFGLDVTILPSDIVIVLFVTVYVVPGITINCSCDILPKLSSFTVKFIVLKYIPKWFVPSTVYFFEYGISSPSSLNPYIS